MARAARDGIPKDVNGNMNDHLHSHIHLTNCIHVKNHIHKNNPILADRALLRDLVFLQRSRPLRDPSASQPPWRSASVADMLHKREERDVLVDGRRSISLEHRKERKIMSGSSPAVTDPPISKAATGRLRRHLGATAVSDRNRKGGFCGVRREESSRMNQGNDAKSWNSGRLQHGNVLAGHASRSLGLRDKSVKKRGGYIRDGPLNILSDQLEDIPAESDDAALSCNHDQRHAQMEKVAEEEGANICSHGDNTEREKRRKFQSARRNRPSISTRAAEIQREMSVASNSFAQGRDPLKYQVDEDVEEYNYQNVTSVPGNRCGIPWNWSRIHHRGKSFLDMAGRSLSCGLSESRLKKDGTTSQGRGISDMPVMSEQSSSSTMSEGEALPLLLDASGSQASIDGAPPVHDYSGELGLFVENLLRQEIDSDLALEGRSRKQHRFQRQHTDRHQDITQKYMPRTFRDLVGQNLVVQALSNAIMKRKVGLLYVFYGPHGTGKTTCARIFAKALNCQSLESMKPCGFCDSCISHDLGKSRNVREIGPVSKVDLESVIEVFNDMIASCNQSQYGVFIFDECDTLTTDCWSAILKVIDQAPRHVVFILVCTSLDVLPHIIISRCQKFFFSKLKDADISYTLQSIATKEDLEIDKDALKLIASRSDGSLRDAEMTLEQLSLLGQRISLCLVQELIGLISDDKLVDLLDSALSADTINTVKNLRVIMESGVEPLALMSQLATVITDILAGSYDTLRGRPKRNFFQRQALSKEEMEKLRQALKTLSEAERQLRVSNDKMTWLTAALLQLAPDQHNVLPGSSADSSSDHSPLVLNSSVLRLRPRKTNAEMHTSQARYSGDLYFKDKSKGIGMKENEGRVLSQQVDSAENDLSQMKKVRLPGKLHLGLEEIWLEVLEKIPINSLKEFLNHEGKLISVSYGAAPTVQLLFNSQLIKSELEKLRSHILQAFESVLKSHVTIEIRHGSREETGSRPILLPGLEPSDSDAKPVSLTSNRTPKENNIDIKSLQIRDTLRGGVNRSEIIEVEAPPSEYKCSKCKNIKADSNIQNTESATVGAVSTQKRFRTIPFPDKRKLSDRSQSRSLVRSKVSLADVIQHAEGCSQYSGLSKRKAVSIAEKLEQENLRLEPRSRRLLCWNPPRLARPKISCWKIRTRKPQTVMKLVSCGRCLSGRSSR